MPTHLARCSPSARASWPPPRDGFAGLDEVVVRSLDERPLPLQVDGDYVDDVTEARYGLKRRHITVVS